MMQPVYLGAELVFTRNENVIESNGVLFYPGHLVTQLSEQGFQAYAINIDQTDIFRIEGGTLFNRATIRYGDRTSDQPQIF